MAFLFSPGVFCARGARARHCARCCQPMPGMHHDLYWELYNAFARQAKNMCPESSSDDDDCDDNANYAHHFYYSYRGNSGTRRGAAPADAAGASAASEVEGMLCSRPWNLRVVGGKIAIPKYNVLNPGLVPKEFECPVTYELMRDPLVASDGHTYDAASLKRWFSENKDNDYVKSPITLVPLMPYAFRNIKLNQAIQEWVKGHGDVVQIVGFER